MKKPDGETDQWAKDGEIHATSTLMMKSTGVSDSAGKDKEGSPLELVPDWTFEY